MRCTNPRSRFAAGATVVSEAFSAIRHLPSTIDTRYRKLILTPVRKRLPGGFFGRQQQVRKSRTAAVQLFNEPRYAVVVVFIPFRRNFAADVVQHALGDAMFDA